MPWCIRGLKTTRYIRTYLKVVATSLLAADVKDGLHPAELRSDVTRLFNSSSPKMYTMTSPAFKYRLNTRCLRRQGEARWGIQGGDPSAFNRNVSQHASPYLYDKYLSDKNRSRGGMLGSQSGYLLEVFLTRHALDVS